MPRGVYTITAENVTVATASGDVDFAALTPADDKPITPIGYRLDCLSEVGDAQEEHPRLQWIRGHTTSGSGGTATTPRPTDPADAAAGFTCETFNTTVASVGTTHALDSPGPNVRIGEFIPIPPEMRVTCTQAEASLVLRLLAALADDSIWNITVWVKEGV